MGTRYRVTREQGDRQGWLLVAWLVAATLAVLLALMCWQYFQLRSDLDQACSGVVARLDLTEWVPLCR